MNTSEKTKKVNVLCSFVEEQLSQFDENIKGKFSSRREAIRHLVFQYNLQCRSVFQKPDRSQPQ